MTTKSPLPPPAPPPLPSRVAEIGDGAQAGAGGGDVRALEALHALRTTAILQPGLTEAEVMHGVVRQLEALGLRGAISRLDDEGRTLVIRALAFPNQKALAVLERLTGLNALGFTFPVQRVEAYRHVVATGEALFVSDSARVIAQLVPESARGLMEKILSVFGSQQSVFAPIHAGGRVVGVLTVSARTLDEADQAVAEVFAAQVGAALENARLLKETRDSRDAVLNMLEDLEETAHQLREKTERLTVLGQIARVASSSLDPDEVMEAVTREVRRLIPCDHATIALLDREAGQLVMRSASIDGASQIAAGVRVPIADTPAKVVLETGQPLARPDLSRHERAYPLDEWLLAEGIRSDMLIPLIVRGEVIGSLNLAAYRPHAFDEAHLALAQELVGHVAVAIENARLYEEIRQRVAELSSLQDVGAAIAGELHLDDVLELVVRSAAELTKAENACVCLLSPDGRTRTHVYCFGEQAALLRDKTQPSDTGLHGAVLTTGEPLLVNEVAARPRPTPLGLEMDIRRIIIVPLRIKGRIIGTLDTFSTRSDHTFDERDLRLLSAVADHAAIAIENARLFREITATADELGQRNRELGALFAIASVAAQTLELDEVLKDSLDTVLEVLEVEAGGIYLLEPGGETLALSVHRGLSDELVKKVSIVKMGEGLAGRAAAERKAVTMDIAEYPSERLAPFLRQAGFQSLASVPLVAKDRVLGALNLASRRPRVFPEAEIDFLTSIGYQLGGAVENARLFEETRVRAEQLALLYEAGLTLNSMLEPRAQLEFLFNIAMRALRADRAEFFRFDPARNEMAFEFGLGYSAEILDTLHKTRFHTEEEHGLIGWVKKNRAPLRLPDVSADLRYVVIDPEIRSGLCVPVERNNQCLGTLAVFRTRADAFTPQDERLLVLFANQAAVALENSRLYQAIERRLAELTALFEVSSALRQARTVDQMLPIILEQTARVMGADTGVMLLREAETGDLISRAFFPPERPWTAIRQRPGEGITGHVALTGQIHVSPELSQDPLAHIRPEEADTLAGIRSSVAAPLKVGEAVVGVMHIGTLEPKIFDETDCRLLTAIADMAANAIRRTSLHDKTVRQAQELARLVSELEATYDATLAALSAALDARDHETEGHSRRVTQLAVTIARAMELPESDVEELIRGALLHDIGKIGVPDSILSKPGPLTDEERAEMQRHPQIGYDMLKDIKFLASALPVVLCHHERWDGGGYPRRLQGAAIPLAARIFAVADAYDAMTSDRPYRAAMSHAEALAEIRREAGKQFDPQVADVFLATVQQWPSDEDFHILYA
ncbi:MAG: GAF domain-containing protein [Anaerolineae bacterium]